MNATQTNAANVLPFSALPIARFRDSNDTDESKPWFAASDVFNLAECGRLGRGTVNVGIAGFWSHEAITLRVERRRDFKTGAVSWEVSISRSSGGRYTQDDGRTQEGEFRVAVEDDLTAAENFAVAMLYTVSFGREIRKHTGVLEQFYQDGLASW